MNLTHDWHWEALHGGFPEACEACGAPAIGRIVGNFEGVAQLGGELLPRRLSVSIEGYSCGEHVEAVAELVDKRGRNALRPRYEPHE